jgi:hypothetical protein
VAIATPGHCSAARPTARAATSTATCATSARSSGWLRTAGSEPADDLELAVLLVNSHDELADPPDRLATLDWYAAVLRAVGHPEHANALGPGDLGVLRALRGGLRAAFTAATPEAAALALNPLLLTAAAVPVLVPGPDSHVQLRVAPGATGLPALAARLPTALAAHIARYGLTRLGSCAAHPCACVYVDRTKPATGVTAATCATTAPLPPPTATAAA